MPCLASPYLDHGHTTKECNSLKSELEGLAHKANLDGVVTPHNDSLVTSIIVNNCEVQRVLVDVGSAPNVMYYHYFESLSLDLDTTLLQKYDGPIYGFNNQPVPVEGVLRLNVAFDSGRTYMIPSVQFLVVKMTLSFNIVIGRPTLTKIKAIVSQSHLCIKFPTPMGVATLKGGGGEAASNQGRGVEALADCHPLPSIDQLVEAKFGNERLSLLDAYSVYHQDSWFLEGDKGQSREDKVNRGNETTEVSQRCAAPNWESSSSAQKDEAGKPKKFEWTSECQASFDELKVYLSSPPLLTKVEEGEILYLYLEISDTTISSILVREMGKQQRPVYYVNKVLQGIELRYSIAEKATLAVVTMERKLRPTENEHVDSLWKLACDSSGGMRFIYVEVLDEPSFEKSKVMEGIDLMGPFVKGVEGVTHLVVVVDYFTKWVEARPLSNLTLKKIEDFIFSSIICSRIVPNSVFPRTSASSPSTAMNSYSRHERSTVQPTSSRSQFRVIFRQNLAIYTPRLPPLHLLEDRMWKRSTILDKVAELTKLETYYSTKLCTSSSDFLRTSTSLSLALANSSLDFFLFSTSVSTIALAETNSSLTFSSSEVRSLKFYSADYFFWLSSSFLSANSFLSLRSSIIVHLVPRPLQVHIWKSGLDEPLYSCPAGVLQKAELSTLGRGRPSLSHGSPHPPSTEMVQSKPVEAEA
ncbi:hypothetical protein SLEP1_g27649 [Rubroshorea leprosula]|uniref:Reverse transcriptase/retrotransposon-derived protein RNase H-like domain-containing protein n=1 Tax=Rubroshorea leprosula TaxID=152421 RepID=A0AAV5JY66_9ROSI|nr:hypothetical protein SLEP1_g27649 [Rubroshorea leprosula]